MMPLGDENRHGVFPVVTIALIVINVLAFLYELSVGALSGPSSPFLESFAVQSNEIRNGQELHTLLTSMFLHGGWLHLLSNMLYLWVFGDNIEAALGPALYIVFYLAGGVVASLAHVMIGGASNVPSLGASGAIAAVLGAYLVMFPNQRVRVLMPMGRASRIGYTSALVMIGMWAALQFFAGLGSIGSTGGGVAYWAHIGGFVFGVVVGMLLKGAGRQPQTA